MAKIEFPTIRITENSLDSSVLSPIAEIVRQFSNTRPALLRLGVTNEDTATRTFQCGVPKPFAGVQNDPDDEHRMYLIPKDERGLLHDSEGSPIVPSEPDDGCWRVDSSWGDSQILDGFRLEPGESNTNEYVVLAPPDGDDCLPPDEYHFEATLWADGERLPWRLTITV